MNVQPLGSQVLVSLIEEKSKTESGIFLPNNFESDHRRGKIIAKGPGHILANGDTRSLDVNVGDEVLFSSHTSKLTIGDDVCYLIKEEQLDVVITP